MTAAAFKFPKPTPKKAPLERGQHRRKSMRAGRPKRLDRVGANPDHLHRLHFDACEVRRIEYRPGYWRILTPAQAGCRGRIEAAHEGEKKPGMSLKSSDDKALALCKRHHREWGNPARGGFFGSMTPEQRREWASNRGAESEARMMAHGGRRSA